MRTYIGSHKVIASGIALLVVLTTCLGVSDSLSGSQVPTGRHVATAAPRGKKRPLSTTTTTTGPLVPSSTSTTMAATGTNVPLSQPTSPRPTATAKPPAIGKPTGGTVILAATDPTFVQSQSDPLAITFAYSASATEVTDGVSSPDPSLPDGVLQLFTATTPGQPSGLVCSMNVGGSVDGGNCSVEFHDVGSYQVTSTYLSNSASYTATETDTISPFSVTIGATDRSSGVGVTTAPDGATCIAGPGVGCQLLTAVLQGKGDATSPPVGALTFDVYDNSGNVITTLTPKTSGQTDCLIQWTFQGPPWTASAVSSNCSGGTTVSYKVLGFPYTAAFAQPGYTTTMTDVQGQV